MAEIQVDGDRTDSGWRFDVRLDVDGSRSTHEVTVDQAYLDRVAPGADPEALVRASFRFLLEREPQDAIVPRFDLPLIAHYFPTYEDELVKRL